MKKNLLTKVFLALAAVESAAAIYALLSLPSDVNGALLWGLSAPRLLVVFGMAAIFLATFALWAWLSASPVGMERALRFTDHWLESKGRALVFISAIIAAGGLIFLLTPAERIGEAIYQRVFPVVALLFLLALQTLIFQFIYEGKRIHWQEAAISRRNLIPAGITFAGFILAWIFIAWSGIGIIPEKSGWLTPGAPILAQQVFFAWMIGIAFLVLGKQLDRYKKSDLAIAFGVWLIAGMVWYLEPMTRWGYFTPKPTPPNFEYYPYSDAILHDGFAQTILIGASRQIDFTVRPLYTLFVTLLHLVFGQKFETVIAVQVFILAVTPAFVYLLSARLGGRAAGILAAALVILREKNGIALTNIIEISHSKLLMSDLPTMTMLVIFMFLLVSWFQDSKNRLSLGALAGAFLGMTILIRSQSQLLIPIALLWILISKKDGWKAALQKVLVFGLGLFVVLVPWVWRNYQVSGRAVVEYQEAYTTFFAGNYASAPQEIEALPGETQDEYDSRMMSLIVHNIFADPQKFIRKFSSYTIHNEILSLAYLPLTLKFEDLSAYIKGETFWDTPFEPIPLRVLPFFLIYLWIIALGVGTSFRRAGWMGVVPLFLHFGYSFSTTFIFAAGWRFIQPVDWVSLLYFSIGLIQVSLMGFALFTKKQQDEGMYFNAEYTPVLWRGTFTTLALLAVFGIALPLFEYSFPERYPALDAKSLVQKYIPDGFKVNGGAISATDVESFLTSESNSVILYGRALYPSYYPRGEFWGDSLYLNESKQYNRLEFTLIGSKRENIYLPIQTAPRYFPHASNVFLIGCESPNAIRALVVMVNDKLVTTSPWIGLTCDEK